MNFKAYVLNKSINCEQLCKDIENLVRQQLESNVAPDTLVLKITIDRVCDDQSLIKKLTHKNV